MKTMTRVVAVALVAVMMCMVLASCGNTISGSYSRTYEDNGLFGWGAGTYTTTYEFSGKKVTKITDATIGNKTETKTQTGVYELTDDGKIVFTWDKDVQTGDGQSSVSKETYAFDKGDGFILIDDKKYEKK